jgi:hypothetical protein
LISPEQSKYHQKISLIGATEPDLSMKNGEGSYSGTKIRKEAWPDGHFPKCPFCDCDVDPVTGICPICGNTVSQENIDAVRTLKTRNENNHQPRIKNKAMRDYLKRIKRENKYVKTKIKDEPRKRTVYAEKKPKEMPRILEFPNRFSVTTPKESWRGNAAFFERQTLSIIFSHFKLSAADPIIATFKRKVGTRRNSLKRMSSLCREYFQKYGPSTLTKNELDNELAAYDNRMRWGADFKLKDDGRVDEALLTEKQRFERTVKESSFREHKRVSNPEKLSKSEMQELLETDSTLVGAIIYLSNKLYRIPLDSEKALELKKTLLVNLYYSTRFSLAYDALRVHYYLKAIRLKGATGKELPAFSNVRPLGKDASGIVSFEFACWTSLQSMQKIEKALNVVIVNDQSVFMDAFLKKKPTTVEEISSLPGVTSNFSLAVPQLSSDLRIFDGLL